MDSPVLLPASGASNGFSSLSASALISPPPTTSSPQSSFSSPRPTSSGTSSTSADRSVVLAEDSGDRKTRNNERARVLRSDRQRAAWDEMHGRMELRRREWNAQVDRMRTDFFKLKPPTTLTGDAGQSSAVITADRRQQRVIDVGPSLEPSTITRQQFQVNSYIS